MHCHGDELRWRPAGGFRRHSSGLAGSLILRDDAANQIFNCETAAESRLT